MDTLRLDLNKVMAQGDASWLGVPDGTVVGHVHMQVGDLDAAQGFITDSLGMDLTSRLSGARFFSSGGYHHHLAGNIWNSRGAGSRSPNATGLAEIVLEADADALAALSGPEFTDPWGTRINVQPK